MGMFNPSQAMSQNISAQNALNGTAGPALTTGVGMFGSSVDPVAMQQMMQMQQNDQMMQSAGNSPYARLGAIQASNAKMLSGALSTGIDAFANGGQSSDPLVQKQQVLKNIQQQFANRDDMGSSKFYHDAGVAMMQAGLPEQAQMAFEHATKTQAAEDVHTKSANENAIAGDSAYQAAKRLEPILNNAKTGADIEKTGLDSATLTAALPYVGPTARAKILDYIATAHKDNAEAGLDSSKTIGQNQRNTTVGGNVSGDVQKYIIEQRLLHQPAAQIHSDLFPPHPGYTSPAGLMAMIAERNQGKPKQQWPSSDQVTFNNLAGISSPINAAIGPEIDHSQQARLGLGNSGPGGIGGTGRDIVPNTVAPTNSLPRLGGGGNAPPPKLPPPTLDMFLSKARAANPGASDAELKQYYLKKYGNR